MEVVVISFIAVIIKIKWMPLYIAAFVLNIIQNIDTHEKLSELNSIYF